MGTVTSSIETCRNYPNFNCTVPEKGAFVADASVAGRGVTSVFIGISITAFGLCLVHLLIQQLILFKQPGEWIFGHRRETQIEKFKRKRAHHKDRLTWSEIFEATIHSLSDQQLFTGLAYVISLRYALGCKVSAYHYDIITQLLLISCATHLSSIALTPYYFRNPYLGTLRLILIAGVFVTTGLLFANQNGSGSSGVAFPTQVPGTEVEGKLLVMKAACFQSANTGLLELVGDTFHSGDKFFNGTSFLDARPNNYLAGYGSYLIVAILSLLAILQAVVTWFVRFKGWEEGRYPKVKKCVWVYKVIVVVAGLVVIIRAFVSVQAFRQWLNTSDWLSKEEENPENTLATFGQMMSMLMLLLTVYKFVEVAHAKHKEYYGRQSRYKKIDSDLELSWK